MTFTTLLEGFKGFFSRSFWFGSFLPVALIAAAHGAIAAIAFGLPAAAIMRGTIGETPGMALLVFAGLVILAYALGPVTPMFNGLLDGTLLPVRIHDALRRGRATRWRADVAGYRAAQTDFATASDPDAMGQTLHAIRNAAKPASTPEGNRIIRAGIQRADTLLDEIERTANKNWKRDLAPARSIDLDALGRAVVALRPALAQDIAALDLKEPAGHWSERADKAIRRIGGFRREAVNETRHRLDAMARRLPILDLQDWQATRLGDARYKRERYVRDTYGVSFAYLWPRIRMAIADGEQDDGKGLPRTVADAAALVDFAVLLMALSLTIPALWLPLIAGLQGSVWLFLEIGIATPVVLIVLYELALRSEMAFGDIVATAVDRYRLAIFPLLGMPLPPTLSAERDLWSRLERASWSGGNVELVYRHGPS